METVERRLSAILSADAVGYTRLMADDELATVQTIRAYRERIASLVGEHRGRVVDSPGDNLLAEFPSALDAMRSAVAIQLALREENRALDESRRMPFRIGVHLGDVMVDGERIYGNGVNIAARLEGTAPVGGICLSASVHELVRGALGHAFEDLGEQLVKNVPHPVRVFRVVLEGKEPGAAALRASAPEQPALAVLPFDNLSRDPEHEFLADGIAADLITSLSAWRFFPVIARSSSFTYKGRAVDVKQVSRELGARYLVSGSVRAAGSRVRVGAELVDATTGHYVWADKYDRSLDEIFALQDEVTESIVAALQPALRGVEAEHARRAPPESLEAWAIVNRAWIELQSDIMSRETAESSLRAADRALEMASDYALAHAVRGFALSLLLPQSTPGESTELGEEAERSIRRAVELAPDDSGVLQMQGAAMGNLGRTEDAIRAHTRALELDPSNAQARASLGIALIFVRQPEEGLAHIDRAMALSPRDPLLYNWLGFRALGCLVLGRYEEAVAVARSSLERRSTRNAWMTLSIGLGQLGRLEEAREASLEFGRVSPEFSVSRFEPIVRSLALRPEDGDRFVAAMRKVGFRE